SVVRARNWSREAILPVGARTFGQSALWVAFRPGGDLLLVRNSTQAFVWDWRADKPVPWGDALAGITAACWSPDGQFLALGRQDRLQLHKVPAGDLVHESRSPDGASALAFSRDGRYLAVPGRMVRLFPLPPQTLL